MPVARSQVRPSQLQPQSAAPVQDAGKACNLDAVKEPTFDVVFQGKTRSFDPFKLADKLQAAQRAVEAGSTSLQNMNAIRTGLGFAALADDDVNASETLTNVQCLAVIGALYDFVKSIPEVKKLSDLTQNSSDSTRA